MKKKKYKLCNGEHGGWISLSCTSDCNFKCIGHLYQGHSATAAG